MKAPHSAEELYDHIMSIERKIKRSVEALTFTEQMEHYHRPGRIKLETVTIGGPITIIKGAA
jgi:hypothetical protein